VNTEHWTPVKGYETLYEITETGQVRSWAFGGWRRRTAPKLLKWRINTFGYATVALSNGPGTKPWNVLVHRLVALNFIPNPANAPQINHKDSNKLNNHISNLEWVTQRENLRHSWRVGTHVSKRGEFARHAKLKQADIDQIQAAFKAGRTGPSIAKQFSISPNHAYRIRDNVHWRPYLTTTYSGSCRE